MAIPIVPIDESAAEPTAVDYPAQSVVETLPAERTKGEDIEDTGYIWEQTYPGEDDPMAKPADPVIRAVRTTEVSDTVLFGSAIIGPDTPPFILVPAHRDRVRVTIVAPIETGGTAPAVYLGSGPDISPGNGWRLMSGTLAPHLRLPTRDAIWATSGPGGASDTVRVQWAIELVSEGCGCK